MDLQSDPGRIVVREIADEEWPWYWHAFIGDTRVNGGLAHSYFDGHVEGKRAIATCRKKDFYENFYFDQETHAWYRKGELPPE